MRFSLVALSLPLLSLASPPSDVFGPSIALPEGIPIEDPASLEPVYRVLERESSSDGASTKEKRFWDRFSAQTKDHYEASTFELQLAKDIKAMEKNRLGRHLLVRPFFSPTCSFNLRGCSFAVLTPAGKATGDE